MKMVQILLGILGIMAIWYLVVFAKDYKEFKTNNAGVDEGSTAAHAGIGLGVNFFDTLGIGGFAQAIFIRPTGVAEDQCMISGFRIIWIIENIAVKSIHDQQSMNVTRVNTE